MSSFISSKAYKMALRLARLTSWLLKHMLRASDLKSKKDDSVGTTQLGTFMQKSEAEFNKPSIWII